ncbi:leucine-rich repeat domain-containing protein [Legionella beliardensis]|nr:leucine-rich repeat domain-containing protein [Legionella beliardensis]
MQLSDDGQILLKVHESDVIDGYYEIPVGVTTIDFAAFAECPSLQKVTLPAEITTINKGAFTYCSSLQTITFSAGVTTIGMAAFHGCSSLQTITIPAGVTTISFEAFSKCSNLQTITLPAGLTTIEDQAFSECSSLQMIVIPAGVTTISFSAFKGCSSLQTIVLPIGITTIGDWAFEECSSLQTITIPAGVTTIGLGAFSECSSLQTITLPAGITTINYNTFNGCSSLQTITLPAGITGIADNFFGCNNLNCIIIDSDHQAELERMTDLLPEKFKNKVVSKRWLDEVICFRDDQLARLIKAPQTNPLYRFFRQDARFVSKVEITNKEGKITAQACSKLPDEIFWHINEQIGKDNPYYQKAQALISSKLWPTTNEELEDYKIYVRSKVKACIKEAIKVAEDDANVYSHTLFH